MNKELITVWVSKYALTRGIFSVKAREFGSGMIVDLETGIYYGSDSWHRTKEEAIKRAEEMRVRKIASLKKQLEKLEKMRFTEEEENGKEEV